MTVGKYAQRLPVDEFLTAIGFGRAARAIEDVRNQATKTIDLVAVNLCNHMRQLAQKEKRVQSRNRIPRHA